MTVTPVKKGTKKPGSGSGSLKMKQLSLMSFFKPAAAKTPSSPLKAKNEPLHAESDKENDLSMMEDATTETPLTLETNNVVDTRSQTSTLLQ